MPKTTNPRRNEVGDNLAKRIQLERERRGLSYEALAKLMTEAGCITHGSAIYKIENGQPRRRIDVDELVALGQVLKIPPTDLLKPLELVEQERAQELLGKIEDADDQLFESAATSFRAWKELKSFDPEVQEYIAGHYGRRWPESYDPFGGLERTARYEIRRKLWRETSEFRKKVQGLAASAHDDEDEAER